MSNSYKLTRNLHQPSKSSPKSPQKLSQHTQATSPSIKIQSNEILRPFPSRSRLVQLNEINGLTVQIASLPGKPSHETTSKWKEMCQNV